jgi:hypothetical protein
MMPPIAADSATAPAAPRFLNAGETALVVEFGETVDPAINDRVWRSMRRCGPILRLERGSSCRPIAR